jgi:hypothetical protein
VLGRLEIRLRTPPALPSEDTLWQSKTPSSTVEFGSQSRLVCASFGQSLETIQDGFSQLVKGAKLMLHQSALLALRNSHLEEQLAVLTKWKTHKRKYIQYGGTLEFGAAADQVAQTTSM